jgi:hypothetical protein
VFDFSFGFEFMQILIVDLILVVDSALVTMVALLVGRGDAIRVMFF